MTESKGGTHDKTRAPETKTADRAVWSGKDIIFTAAVLAGATMVVLTWIEGIAAL